jgi:RNA 3'-terminal phosphate cyclase (ATP)
VTVAGGTHVAWSPPYHYLEQVFLPALHPLGYQAQARLEGWGFYPRGGGRITLEIQPWQKPAGRHPAWSEPRGSLQRLQVMSAAALVGNQVTARQARQAYNRLAEQGLRAETQLVNPRAPGPGTCVFLLAEYGGGARAGFTGYGRRGYPAERVADDAVDAFLRHHGTGAPVDPHLADQLVLPVAASQQPLAYATSRITQHLLTNIWVISQFLDSRLRVEGQEGDAGQVEHSAAEKLILR